MSVCLLSSYYPVCLLTTALPLYYCLSLPTVQPLPCLLTNHGTATVLLTVCLLSSYYPVCLLTTALPLYYCLSTVQLLPCLFTDHGTATVSVCLTAAWTHCEAMARWRSRKSVTAGSRVRVTSLRPPSSRYSTACREETLVER